MQAGRSGQSAACVLASARFTIRYSLLAIRGSLARNKRLALQQSIDLGLAVAKLDGDGAAVAADERGGTTILPQPGGKFVRMGHVDHLAFHRMVELVKETDSVEVLVLRETLESVHRTCRHIRLLQDAQPFGRGTLREALRAQFKIFPHMRVARRDRAEARDVLELLVAGGLLQRESRRVGVGGNADKAILGLNGLAERMKNAPVAA